MRFLILSSILACAAAAPSGALVGSLSPIPIPAIPIPAIKTLPGPITAIPISGIKTLPGPVISAIPIIKAIPAVAAIPVAAPTISPGDLQAAAINAKVEVEDYLRAAADKNREINEQALKGQADKIVEASNLNSEKNQEAFWEVEDKKWQALNALQTAQAQVDGFVASNAELLGQTVLTPTPGAVVYGAVPVKSGEKVEENKEEVKAEEVKEDSVQIESADAQFVPKTPAAVAENEEKISSEADMKLKESGIISPIVANFGIPLYAPIAGVPVNLNEVGWPTTLIQPGVKILTPGLSVAQEGLVASVAGKSSW